MNAKFVHYTKETYSEDEVKKRSAEHLAYMDKRRTVREFSSRPIPYEVLENIVMTASTAPSGAHKQPWTFCIVTDTKLKSKIRVEAEKEEFEFYNNKILQDWQEDLSYLGTDWHKPFLEIAPALIVVFKQSYDVASGKKRNNYYVSESIGIACGFLLEAIHYCGLVALTHTPSPMNFLSKILNRPDNEKPFLLIPIGYPCENTLVPDLVRKNKTEVIQHYK